MAKYADLTGKRFGRLTVLEDRGTTTIGKQGKRAGIWLCRCQCGKEVVVLRASLTTGKTQSCGCLQQEIRLTTNITHGFAKTATYRTWRHIKDRCLNSKNKDFKHYGGRGIKVCDRWLKFGNFLEDMGRKPERLTIDRIDNNGNYELSNCRWATQRKQTRNSRRNRTVRYNGTTRCLIEWAEILGIGRATLAYRLKHYPPQIAFNM